MQNSRLPSHYQNLNEKFIKLITNVGKNSIYLGNIAAAIDQQTIRDYKITAVVTVCTEMTVKFDKEVEHLVLTIQDTPVFNILQYILQANNFISSQLNRNKNVLIHCYMGKSRSATLVIGFLMAEKKINLQRALEIIRQSVPHCEPNPGFIRQLLLFEKSLFGGISSRLQSHHSKFYQIQEQPGFNATQFPPEQISSPKVFSMSTQFGFQIEQTPKIDKIPKESDSKSYYFQNYVKRVSVPQNLIKQQSQHTDKEKNLYQSAQAYRSPVNIQKVNGNALSGNAFTTGSKTRLNTKIEASSNKPELQKSNIITKPFVIPGQNYIICKN